MDYDIQVDNLGCDSRLFHSASHTALTPPLRDRVLASWSPMGLGVFSRRGNRLFSDGEPVNVLPEKGKEDCRNPWRYLRPSWERNTRLTLGGFLAPVRGSALPQAKCHEGWRSSERETPPQGGEPDVSQVHPTEGGSPSMGRPLGPSSMERKKAQNKKKKRKQSTSRI